MAYDRLLPETVDDVADEEAAMCLPVLITARNFKAAVAFGSFSDDGVGHPAKDGMVDETIYIDPPSTTYIPDDATHVLWYPK